MDHQSEPFLYPQKEYQDSESDTVADLEDASTIRTATMDSARTPLLRSSSSRLLRGIVILLALWGFGSICLDLAHVVVWVRDGGSISLSSISISSTTNVMLTGDALAAVNGCDCGASTAEALSRGCIYDSLASAWLPAECRDDELTAEFERAGPGPGGAWPYFLDREGTVPINLSRIALMADTGESFYSTKEWHVAHCNFYWRKLFRLPSTGAIMERRNDRIEHIKHCGSVILDERPLKALVMKSDVALKSLEGL